MTAKYIRIAAAAGALAVAVGALTACNDSSTASAPIGTEPVTTTTMPGSDSSKSLKSSSASAEASKQAEAGASKATVSVPETKPNASTTPPDNFPGSKPPPPGVTLSAKDKAYLTDLKKQNVAFMGDDDNNVALTMGHYVCESRKQNADPIVVKAYVRAAIGPMTKTDAEATAKADKVINAAEKNLC